MPNQPVTYSIRILPEASEDLVKIVDFIREDSPQSAARVAEALFQAIDSLTQLPQRFRIHKSAGNPNRVVRSVSVSPYIIYYRIRQKELWLEILTIRHGARLQPRVFKG